MKITVLAFGIVKEIFHDETIDLEMPKGSRVEDMRLQLDTQFPKLKSLASYIIALNNEYVSSDHVIKIGDEVAIIPPVSGG